MTAQDRAAPGGPWGADSIRVRFGGTLALDDVSVTAVPGAITAVVGGDGAGKTTLLRCLAGVLAPDSGTVRRPGPLATGYFPASTGTYPDLTVAENLAFRASAYNLRGSRAAERAAELTELAGLTAARDRPAGALSGGMRRKLGVIAAMLHRPALLILDEPSTGVDPVSRSGLWWLITRAAADGAAVVLATTYLDEAERTGTVLVLDTGHRLAAGPPAEIIAAMPGTVAELIAEPVGADTRRAWRRNGRWRVWEPPGEPDPSSQPHAGLAAGKTVDPDLQDAVTVAALAREVAAAQGDGDDAQTGPDPAAGPPGPCRTSAAVAAAPPRPGLASAGSDSGPTRAGSAPLLRCADVSCVFGHFVAVAGVSMEVRPGEVVGLLGANGAGKTTLIRMLLGLQRASAGEVTLLGEPPSRRTRGRIGYVPQGLGLYDDLTAAENMAFAAAAFGVHPPALPPDIAAPGAVPAGVLPLGLQRRLAFAQALAHDPGLLILDEPTSGVDPLGRARLWDTIARTAERGAGVLVSTHYLEEAGECDRLIVMSAGSVVASGTVAQITGTARVTLVQTDDWADAFGCLTAAGIPVALHGQALRARAAEPEVAAVLRAGGLGSASLSRAPATLEEIFFDLASRAGKVTVPA